MILGTSIRSITDLRDFWTYQDLATKKKALQDREEKLKVACVCAFQLRTLDCAQNFSINGELSCFSYCHRGTASGSGSVQSATSQKCQTHYGGVENGEPRLQPKYDEGAGLYKVSGEPLLKATL